MEVTTIESSGRRIYTVSALTQEIKDLIESNLGIIWVEGEISDFRAPMSGHYYMTLKDEFARIRAVMFRPQIRFLKFVPEDGMKVIAQGRVTVYEPRGEYQIIIEYLEPLGVGALALAFEQLKRKLMEEGLFDPDKKRPIPSLPQRVAVITSPTGAAIRDFLKIIHRRFANIQITIVPVKVQGEEATAEIINALDIVNRYMDVDVIVLTRGGGSLEDLWAFNKEELARAIRASRIPVVSAVGHEIDITIADLAADMRASTPSAAAELLVKEKETLVNKLDELNRRLSNAITNRIYLLKDRLYNMSRRIRDPKSYISDMWLRVDDLKENIIRSINYIINNLKSRLESERRTLLNNAPEKLISNYRQRLDYFEHSIVLAIEKSIKYHAMLIENIKGKINALNPLEVLKRGYSITYRMPERVILRSAHETKKGDEVSVLLHEGEIYCVVEGSHIKRKSGN